MAVPNWGEDPQKQAEFLDEFKRQTARELAAIKARLIWLLMPHFLVLMMVLGLSLFVTMKLLSLGSDAGHSGGPPLMVKDNTPIQGFSGFYVFCMAIIGFMVLFCLVLELLLWKAQDWRPARSVRSVLEFLGMACMLSTVIVLASTGTISSEGIAALLGALAGFIFAQRLSDWNKTSPEPQVEAKGADKPSPEEVASYSGAPSNFRIWAFVVGMGSVLEVFPAPGRFDRWRMKESIPVNEWEQLYREICAPPSQEQPIDGVSA